MLPTAFSKSEGNFHFLINGMSCSTTRYCDDAIAKTDSPELFVLAG